MIKKEDGYLLPKKQGIYFLIDQYGEICYIKKIEGSLREMVEDIGD